MAICLESFLHIFQRINHPDTRSADASYREYQLQEIMDVASLLSSSGQCYYNQIEKKLGNPYIAMEHEQERCGTCPNCLNKKIFPPVSKDGLKTVLFDIFLSGPNQMTGRRTPQCVWRSIRNYPNAGPMILRSCSSRTTPPLGSMKRILFQLIASRIIDIQFDQNENDILLGLHKANDTSTELAMNVNALWDNLNLYT